VSAGTAFSVLTPSGRGAVAVIGVAGSQATSVVNQFFVARNGRPIEEQPPLKLVYGHWGSEDLIVFRRDESSLEIQCHGGSQSVSAIVTDLVAAGSREIPWQEWVAGGNETSIRSEAQIALAEAASFRTAEILLDQWHGALERELDAIGEQLQNGEQSTAEKRLAKLLSTAEFGQHLTRPWRVVIAGRPNVGKSSLINALVGYERAIVFDQPGTTRDVVTASTVIDGWPISLSDTAGLHGSEDEIEKAGMKLARERLATANLVLWVLDATADGSDAWEVTAKSEIDELQLALNSMPLVVVNKIDQRDGLQVPQGILATSAVTREGIEQLLAAISHRLVPTAPRKDDPVLFTERQKVAVTDALWSCRQGDVRGAAETVSNLLHCVKCGD
jgi:tRNA modification GTPase